ncbi:MAG: TonB-dependent receptor [Acidobacteria bacterium]|nr:TonB-dependent receptor [Acidobacteriota bacterium]
MPQVVALASMCLLALLMPAGAAAAQHAGGVTAGGRPVPGAVVTAVHEQYRLVTTTGEAGAYEFELSPGLWDIRIEMFGFEPVAYPHAQGIESTRVEWTLRVQAAPLPATGKTESDYQQVALARTAEDPPSEIAPVAEVQIDDFGAEESFLVSGSLSRGLQAPQEEDPLVVTRTAEKVKGAIAKRDNAIPGAPPGTALAQRDEAAPESRGKMAKMAARAGKSDKLLRKAAARRASAASFGNRRRRSGPLVRGMAWYTISNSALNARPYSLTGALAAKPPYAQNRFGVTLGGPLRIPRLLELERTMFVLSYSATRNRGPYSAFATMPSALEREGDFSHSFVRGPVLVFDPASNQPFPGNRIPRSRFDPIAAGLLDYIPPPNRPGAVRNYQALTSIPRNSDSLSWRINQGLSLKHRLSGGLNLQRRDNENALLYGFHDEIEGSGYTADAGWMWTLGAKRIHDLKLRFGRDRSQALPFFAFRDNVAGRLGIVGPSASPINYGPPNLNFTNFGDLSDGSPVLRRNRNWSVSDSITWVHGTQTIAAGGEVKLGWLDTNTDQNARGSFTLSGLATSGFDGRGQPMPGTGFDFADFLLGLPQSSSIRYGSTDTYFRNRVYSAWLQDDWRVRPNLTVNIGARYDYFSPFTEEHGRIANLDVAPGFTGVAVVTPGIRGPYSGDFPEGLIDPDANNLSPRIGFAWRPLPRSRLQIRGGYSHFYDGSAYQKIVSRLAAQPPFASTASIHTSLARRLTFADGFGGGSAQKITNSFAVARDYRIAYAQTWSFSVQHELPGSFVVDLGYLGTKGTRLEIQRLPNRAAPGSPLTAEQRRQIGNAAGFTYSSSEGNSIFHAGQARLVRRLKKGLSMNALYTWSKSIDNATTIGGAGNVVAQNDRNLALERGLSIFDQRHNFTVSGVVNSPFGENGWTRGGPLARLLENWSISSSLAARSGRPFTARVLGNIADAGGTGAIGSGRADATGEPIDAGGGPFNQGAFRTPPPGRFGNAGRNTIPGPGFLGLNASIARTFDLGDRRRLEFRVSSENMTNRVSYTAIATVVNASNFGLATATAPMRTVSATMRLRF